MSEHFNLTVVEAAKRIKNRDLSPVELVESLLSQYDALEPGLSAWVYLDREEVLEQARRACIADGFEAHWVVFEQRVVRPMLFGAKPASYKSLVERLDLDDRSQAANMMITVKRRFARALYQEIGRTVIDPEQIEDELNELLRDLERPR